MKRLLSVFLITLGSAAVILSGCGSSSDSAVGKNGKL